MPIALTSPYRSRERVLVYGHEGTGKSTDAISIAQACPNVLVWVVDNDNSYDRLIETNAVELPNIYTAGVDFAEDNDPYSWEGMRKSIAEAQAKMGRDDWLIVDMLSKAWDAVQEWFIEQIFQSDIDDYFLKIRMEKERLKATKKEGDKDKKALGAFEGWMDWPVINQTYHKGMSTPLLRCPGHLLCVAEAQKLSEDDDRGIKELYGPLGARPKGQKRSGHIMQTVIMQGRDRGGNFKLTTVKDRGRELWNGEVMEDFSRDYLEATAGWTKTFVKTTETGE